MRFSPIVSRAEESVVAGAVEHQRSLPEGKRPFPICSVVRSFAQIRQSGIEINQDDIDFERATRMVERRVA